MRKERICKEILVLSISFFYFMNIYFIVFREVMNGLINKIVFERKR